jgi:UDP-N-acetylmuramyl pentapeptide synthase
MAAKVDELITIGKNAGKFIVAGAIENGLSNRRIHQCDSPYQAGELAKTLINKGDVVLAKGSQNGVFAEEAVAKLLAKPSERSRLVRQGDDWMEKKRSQFRDAE